MILARETKKKFGHRVKDLKPTTKKYIVYKCSQCLKKFDTTFFCYVNKKTNVCKTCSARNQGNNNFKNLVGKRFGTVVVTKKINKKKFKSGQSHYLYEVTCDCGHSKIKNGSSLLYINACSNWCPLKKTRKRTGYKEITGSHWSAIKHGAKKRSKNGRKIEFKISIEYAYRLFKKQKGICKLSGNPISLFSNSNTVDRKFRTASLDRIDPTKGYVPGNVQWVEKGYNMSKWDFQNKVYIDMCIQVADYYRSNNV